ncbi:MULTISPECIES: type III-B CRISPR module-associated protein Cmr5 [Bacteroidales]|uniref:type III-B CRISPR module-associated protein Cmr5 n=1 Tax=Bacteroidales TaxID=171549 RepID=UPI0035A0711F
MIVRKQEIQELIPIAMAAITAVGIADERGEIEKVHEGYINALGPNILQSGLLPTLIFYNKGTEDNSEGDRRLWLKALYYMYNEADTNKRENVADWKQVEPTAIIKKVIAGEGGTIREIREKRKTELLAWERVLLKYAVTLKLATRTFKIQEKKGGRS